MNAHPIQWRAPRPLWARFGDRSAPAVTVADQERPAILRFASDDFMEQVLGTLARDPSRIDTLVARPETWRAPMGEPADLVERTPASRVAHTGIRGMLADKLKARVAALRRDAADPHARSEARRQPLKLYQPAHQRYYLVASSLICGIPGFPERAVAAGAPEQVNFVIRRLLPDAPGSAGRLREFAYVKGAQGARWRRVSDDEGGGYVAEEELLPAFALPYRDDTAQPRTLWAGFIPVGRREDFVGASVDKSPAPSFAAGLQRAPEIPQPPRPQASKLARLTQFQTDVAEPWKNLIKASDKLVESLQFLTPGVASDSSADAGRYKRVTDFNLQQQNVSWLILLDFADFLSLHLGDVWRAIETGDPRPLAASSKRMALYRMLERAIMPAGLISTLSVPGKRREPKPSLTEALKAIRRPGVREKLESAEINYTKDSVGRDDWPDFHFVLAGVNPTLVGTRYRFDAAGPYEILGPAGAESGDEVDALTSLVDQALDARPEGDVPPLPYALQLRDSLAANMEAYPEDPGWFVARFVFTRHDCGPLHPPALSAPTQQFQLAGFFDPDAPARPIRIVLPVDTSPAGLRKHCKNTAFVLSNMLCGQVKRAKGLGFVDLVLSVLPWPLHKDLNVGECAPCKSGGIDIGMICSLSIPIITICALILLMVIVSLLDFIFRWLPYFIICFPIPGLRGKKR